jgi:hypothetical protein
LQEIVNWSRMTDGERRAVLERLKTFGGQGRLPVETNYTFLNWTNNREKEKTMAKFTFETAGNDEIMGSVTDADGQTFSLRAFPETSRTGMVWIVTVDGVADKQTYLTRSAAAAALLTGWL